MACSLPVKKNMDPICQHCYELIVGNAYQVTSKEKGITMLDIVVCSCCLMEAKRLGLHTEEINLRSKQVSARNRVSHRPRLNI
jgi:hypothetical protein